LFDDKLVPFSQGTAERLMAIAKHPVLSNSAHAPTLPTSWTTLYELTKADRSKLKDAIKDGSITPDREDRDQLGALVLVVVESVSGSWNESLDRQLQKGASHRCGVHHGLVGDLRSSLAVPPVIGNGHRAYTTKHGTVAMMDTEAIGKQAADLLTASPRPRLERQFRGPAARIPSLPDPTEGRLLGIVGPVVSVIIRHEGMLLYRTNAISHLWSPRRQVFARSIGGSVS
jgi:hypothetical protein